MSFIQINGTIINTTGTNTPVRHTVPAGKLFYLMGATINFNGQAGAITNGMDIWINTPAGILQIASSQVSETWGDGVIPLAIVAGGGTITLNTNGLAATGTSYGELRGYEE